MCLAPRTLLSSLSFFFDYDISSFFFRAEKSAWDQLPAPFLPFPIPRPPKVGKVRLKSQIFGHRKTEEWAHPSPEGALPPSPEASFFPIFCVSREQLWPYGPPNSPPSAPCPLHTPYPLHTPCPLHAPSPLHTPSPLHAPPAPHDHTKRQLLFQCFIAVTELL